VIRPTKSTANGEYSFGYDETAVQHPVIKCFPTDYQNATTQFASQADYTLLLAKCAGDAGSIAFADEPLFVPKGKIWFDSSLLAILIEPAVGQNGTMTWTYRGQSFTTNGQLQSILFTESYESKLARILKFTDTSITILPGDGTIDIYPVPVVHDPSSALPEGWDVPHLYMQSFTGKVVSMVPQSTRLRIAADGQWFIANISATRVVVPGGAIITLTDCYASLASCIWSVSTRLSYDGSRKLCGSQTSSTNLGCTIINPLPNGYIRLDTVLVATVDDTQTYPSTYDWASQGPWYLGSIDGPVSDMDFTFDGDWLFIDNPQSVAVRRLDYIQLQDVIVPNACPPSTVNASTLNTQWFSQSGRRQSGLVNGYAVGSIVHPTRGLTLVRGQVLGDLLLQVKGYAQPVQVMDWREITKYEFGRGLDYEDVHVYPALCANGAAATLQSVSFTNITVKCGCTMTGVERVMQCGCKDHLLGSFTCQCLSLADPCQCTLPKGQEDWLHTLEEDLKAKQTNQALGHCYYFDDVQQRRSAKQLVGRTNVTADVNGVARVKRVPHSALLLETHVSCQTNLTLVELYGKAGVYEDDFEPVSYSTGAGGGQCIGWQVIMPNITSPFDDTYDEWLVVGVEPNSTVQFMFAPGGVPIVDGVTVTVSSNDADKLNVLGNDRTYWASDLATDVAPSIMIGFGELRMVVGVYVVFETVGIYVEDYNITIPSVVIIQGSSNGGQTWYYLGSFNSSVYHGRDDLFVPLHDQELTHVKLSSVTPLGVAMILALTNQRCENTTDPTWLWTSTDDVTSLEAVALTDYLVETNKLNSSLPCVCLDTCILGLSGIRLTSKDTCADVRYKSLLMDPYAWVAGPTIPKEALVTAFAPNGTSLANVTYLGLVEGTYWWSFGPEASIPIGYIPTKNDTFVNYLNQSLYYHPQATNVTVTANGSFIQSTYQDLIQRGLACQPGTHCSACGPSNTIDPHPQPGLTCNLTGPTAYIQQLVADMNNRSDHFLHRSSLVTDYLATEGRFYIEQDFVFYRNTLRLSRGPCGDCDGLFRCTTGECVANLRDCPATRYNCPGNGCTRVTVLDKKYTCACDVGYGGKDCSETLCRSGDTKTGLINPYLWCSCGQFPPIKAKPPYTMSTTRALTTAQFIRAFTSLVRPGDYQSYPFFPSFASFGEAVLRSYTSEGGQTVYTTCWFYKRGPFGQPISFMDSAIINPDTLEITGWREWDTAASLNGQTNATVTYVWSHPFQYDEFPFRCGHGACVAKEEDCYNDKLARPPCGDNGKCRLDGTCDCFTGSKTFVYTKEWTNKSMVPYDAENPTNWGHVYPPLSYTQHCAARDCSKGQCEIPLGCYPGSKESNFRDANVACNQDSGHFGKCGVDQAACRRGNVTEPGPCSFLGIPRQRDYRPEEWYCECGDLQTKLAKLSDSVNSSRHREVTELKKNGWGGPVCQFYYCQESPAKMIYTLRDERTLLPYKDHEDYILPGRWTGGACGAPIGPNPDDIVQWVACCPGVPYTSWGFARCTNVLCQIGNVPRCVPVAECTGPARLPMVSACHGKGKARADGTCECTTDLITGVGYGPDESGEGCYKKIQCPVAKSNGKACKFGATDVYHWTELPKVEYWESQIPTLLLREGKNPSYENLVRRLVTGPDDMKALFLTSAVNSALEVQQAIQSLFNCIDIMNASDTNCAAPFGMVPYCGRDIGYYMKGYVAPHVIPPNASYAPVGVSTPLLFDRIYQQYQVGFSQAPDVNKEYVDLKEGDRMVLTFAQPVLISVIKVYGLAFNSTYTAGAELDFYSNETGLEVCSPLLFPMVLDKQWRWGGPNSAQYCQRLWQAYPFDPLSTDYLIHCDGKTFSAECQTWQTSVCKTIPGAVVRSLSSFNEYPGCTQTAICCQPTSPVRQPTSSVTVLVRKGRIGIQELTFLGSLGVVEPIPTGLMQELKYQFTHGDAFSSVPIECQDQLFLSSLLGQDLSYYVAHAYDSTRTPQQYTPANQSYLTAQALCESTGGLLAESRGAEDITNYALFTGTACFADSGAGTKCLVAAKNRNEMQRPNTTDFFVNSCSTWGCYLCWNGVGECTDMYQTSIDIVVSPDADGAMWKTNPGGLMSWVDVINAWYVEDMRQGAMIGYSMHSSSSPNQAIWSLDPNNGERDFVWYLGPSIRFAPTKNVWSDSRNLARIQQVRPGITDVKQRAQMPWPVSPPWTTYSTSRTRNGYTSTVPSDGGYALYWTNPQTCRVSFYSEEFCGNYYSGSDGQAAKHFYVTPADGYGILGQELNGYIMDDCGDRERTPDKDCSNRGSTPVNQFTSLAVEGPCIVIVEHLNADNSRSKHIFMEKSDRTSNPYEDSSWNFNPTYKYDYGCYIQCYRGACDPNTGAFHVVDNPRIDPNIGSNGQGLQTSVIIYPYFDSYQMSMNLRVGPTEQNKGSDEYILGWQTHPFMCARLQVDVIRTIKKSAISASATMVVDNTRIPLLDSTDTYRWTTSTGSPLISHASVDNAVKYAFPISEVSSCRASNRPVIPCSQCPLTQPKGQWEWNQLHYDPNNVQFSVPVGVMNQVSSTQLPPTAVPQVYVNINYANGDKWQYHRLWDLLRIDGQFRAFARLVANLSAPLDFRRRFFLDDCVAVVQNPSPATVPYSYQSVVCEPHPDHRALCLRQWTPYAVQPGLQGDKCGSSCRTTGGSPSQKNAYQENELADPALHPEEHQIYQAWLAGTLDTLYDMGSIYWKGVWTFIRHTVTTSLVWAFEEAREYLLNSWSTRPGRTTLGLVEDPRTWLDFDYKSTWPVDCGVRCSKQTGVCRPMLAVDQKYCDPDHSQFGTTAYVPTNQLPLDILPVPVGQPTIGLKRCSTTIDPSTYQQLTVNGPSSPTNRDFVVLEEVEGQYVILRATKSGTLSWQNTGKSDHGYVFANDTTLYGTYACTPACPSMAIWASPISVTYDTSGKLVLGTFGSSPYTTNPSGTLYPGAQWNTYRTVGYDFFNLTKQTVIKLSVTLAQDGASILDCQTGLGDDPQQEPPASIQLPIAHSECIFEPDPQDDRKVVGQCFCSDVSWGGPTCESPAIVSYLKGKQVCGGWGRPGYMALPKGPDGPKVEVDQDGVWQLDDGTTGCVCVNPGLIIRTRMQQATKYAYPSIFINERTVLDQEYIDYSVDMTTKVVTYTQAETICSLEATDLPSYSSADDVVAFYNLALSEESVFVNLQMDNVTGSLRWTGGDVMVYCTNITQCGTPLSGSVCQADGGDGCKAVHYNNWLLYTTAGPLANLTDGRRDTTYTYSSTLTLTPSKTDLKTPMQVEVLVMSDAQASSSTLMVMNNGTLCPRNSFPTTISGVSRVVHNCGWFAPFNFSFVSATPVIQEILVYDFQDTTRLYTYM
jgi:hypothetical protein